MIVKKYLYVGITLVVIKLPLRQGVLERVFVRRRTVRQDVFRNSFPACRNRPTSKILQSSRRLKYRISSDRPNIWAAEFPPDPEGPQGPALVTASKFFKDFELRANGKTVLVILDRYLFTVRLQKFDKGLLLKVQFRHSHL